MGVHERDLTSFITDIGDAGRHMDFAVEGVRCAGCMRKLEEGVGKMPGVTRVRLNFTNRRLAVEWRDGALDPAGIIDKVEALGYQARPFDAASAETAEAKEASDLLRRLAVAAFAAMNIMLLSVSVWWGNASDITPETRDLFHLISALIALPTLAYSGQPFYLSAFRAIRKRSVNMDVPIAIGITLAVAMSLFQTFQHAEHAYFDSAVMLIFFLLTGRYLEQNMRRRTRAQAVNLASLRADSARRIRPDGSVVEVPVSAIDPGDRVAVAAGERIAVDGVVASGTSEVDCSMVTGETMPMKVEAGDMVYAGTLNLSGPLTVTVTAAAKGMLIDEVQKLLDNAYAAKTGRVALADKAASLYAPLVHTAAALTFLGWLLAGAGWEQSLVIAIAVLIITCPCALGLAIPAVQVVSSGAMFRAGLLLNAGDAIERLAEVDTVVFDKTGTLTLPSPLADAAMLTERAKGIAGHLARASRHPLAASLQALAAGPAPEGLRETPGGGVSGTLDGVEVRLGSADFCGVSVAARQAAEAGHAGDSLVWLRTGDEIAAIPVRQHMRPDAAETVAALRARGLVIEILSGDRAPAVAEIASALGVDDWQAGVTPQAKIARIEALKAEGRRVLMVGDGLNDAPALAAAHVSLSPVTAAHISQAAADGVFLGNALRPVVEAHALARKARGLMGGNLWLAVIYNTLAVPIAIAGFVTPLIAALAMSGSSVLVTLNALRARRA
ncbi:MAG: cadmium-translocating P-type ATPase [Rhodobiaceae bacterium]|nr:cadmium-translocating P-type ATPase [Rhodobiaceae bacterium]